MQKTVIRKGLFETSSSSEDSLSIYQDMKLFILPKNEYEQFVDGKLYVKFDNIHPSVSDDYLKITEENEKFIYENKISRHLIGKIKTIIDVPSWILCPYMDKLYFDYQTYTDMICRHYTDYSFFNYEDGDNLIFGYYGYTED